jgi:hypothetical protein
MYDRSGDAGEEFPDDVTFSGARRLSSHVLLTTLTLPATTDAGTSFPNVGNCERGHNEMILLLNRQLTFRSKDRFRHGPCIARCGMPLFCLADEPEGEIASFIR